MSAKKAAERRMTRKMRYGRSGRSTTNVFSQFKQEQIQEMKEAFDLIDQNRDGIIDKQDLTDMLASLGSVASDGQVDNMLAELPCAMNFTLFLAMFGDKLQGTDPEDTIRNAFSAFDEQGTGTVDASLVREILTNTGDERMKDEEVDAIFRDLPGAEDGVFNYADFARIVKYGVKEQANAREDFVPAERTAITLYKPEDETLSTITEL